MVLALKLSASNQWNFMPKWFGLTALSLFAKWLLSLTGLGGGVAFCMVAIVGCKLVHATSNTGTSQPSCHISGQVQKRLCYCRGAKPPQSLLAQLEIPLPYPNETFLWRSSSINFIRFDPTNASTMSVRRPNEGLWKNTKGRTSWSTKTDFLPVVGGSDLAINPFITQIKYFGRGDKESDCRSTRVLQSTDGAAAWNPTSLVGTAMDNYRTMRLLMDPSDPDTMMAATFVGIFSPTSGWGSYTQDTSDLIEDMGYKPEDPSTVYASGTEFFKSSDGGDTWNAVTNGLPMGTNIFQSVDGCTSWTHRFAGLPNLPINTIVYSNSSRIDAISLVADIGVYYFDKTHSAWALYFTDLPNWAVTDLEKFYPTGKLRLATYGRAAWEGDLYSPLSAVTRNRGSQITVYPNPEVDRLTIEISGAKASVLIGIINGNKQVLGKSRLVDKTIVQIFDFAADIKVI